MDETTATKTCKFCGRELALDHFNKSARSKDGHQSYCRECQSALNKERNTRLRGMAKANTAPMEDVFVPLDSPAPVEKKSGLAQYTPAQIFEYLTSIGYRWREHAIWHEKVIVEKKYVVSSGAMAK